MAEVNKEEVLDLSKIETITKEKMHIDEDP